jgi:hypothetical protein
VYVRRIGCCTSQCVTDLIKYIFHPACGQRDTQLKNLAYYADFIERAACALSSFELSFCPDLVCPADARVMGFPYAELPNGTDRVKGIRGLKPTRVTQWPPPGTVLGKDSVTNVTMTAFDKIKGIRQCTWRVVVPPLEEIGVVALNISVGTYNMSNSVYRQTAFSYTGSVFKMRSSTADSYRGDGGRVGTTKSGKNNGHLNLYPNQTSATLRYRRPFQFDFDFNANILPDVSVELEVLDNREENTGNVTLFGQIETFW